MSWLTEYVRPRIRTLLGQRPDVPDNLWSQCPACEQMVFTRELEKNLRVCPHCGHHMRGTALERLDWTLDAGSFTRIELPKAPADPLTFRDQKRYAERLREARAKTGLEDALVVAHGTIEGARAVVAVMEFNFMGGSMGAAVGEGIVAAARLAVLQQAPLVVFTASGGARMQEGAVSRMQMPRTTIAALLLRAARLLRHAGRHPDCRTRRADWLCRRAGDRTDRARDAAGGVPALRIPARARHHGHGGAADGAARDAGPGDPPATALCAGSGRRRRGA